MIRREFLKTAVLTGSALSAGLLSRVDIYADGKTPKKPNIIFILADDLGWGDLGAYGHPYVKTPNMDRLAREGTCFKQFYVNATVCAPSRVAFMTGQYPAKQNAHTIYLNDQYNHLHGNAPYLDCSVPTLADLMKSAGYFTGHIGKWHLSGRTPQGPDPAELGFDMHKITHSEHVDAEYQARWKTTRYPVTASSHWIMEDAIEFIKKRSSEGKPFYLNLWTLVPHAPLRPCPEEMAVYETLEANPKDFKSWMRSYAQEAKNFKNQMRVYCAALTSLDEAIGKLLDYLHKTDLADDTILILTSDNGPEDYHIGDSSNAGVGSPGHCRGRKRSLYEGGIKVPCIVRWPSRVPAGRISSAVWSGVDLMPTLASITNAVIPNADDLDGEDVSDIWYGSERQHRKEICWEWKFEVAGTADYRPPQLAIRDRNWKLLCDPDGSRIELYNIAEDPAELTSRSGNCPDVAKRLSTRVLNWKRTLPERYNYSN